MVKTKEAVKLADLYCLEAQQVFLDKCRRFLTDAATGSCLLELQLQHSSTRGEGGDDGSNNNCGEWFKSSSVASSSFLRERCDWVAEVVVGNAPNAADLIGSLQARSSSDTALNNLKPWGISYLRMTSGSDFSRLNQRRRNITKTSLLCAVAQSIKAPVALEIAEAEVSLIVLEADEQLYLLRVLYPESKTDLEHINTETTAIGIRWRQRPFQYSSALNPIVARVLIDILYERVAVELDSNKAGDNIPVPSRRVLLDPTCGSGTFLAAALRRGFDKVIGWDVNSACVQGCRENLVHMYGDERIKKDCIICVRDSSLVSNIEELGVPKINCVVANLPWGVNTVKYIEENEAILCQIRSLLSSGTPCAFISKESLSSRLDVLGYRCVGQAQIPQKSFRLPKGSKRRTAKHDIGTEGGKDSVTRTGRSNCVVTIATMI